MTHACSGWTRTLAALILVLQVLGGGAVTLAHARDAVATAPAVEAGHDARCAVLHDAQRCALCHFAAGRVIWPPAVTVSPPPPARLLAPLRPKVAGVAAAFRYTTPPRAPPPIS